MGFDTGAQAVLCAASSCLGHLCWRNLLGRQSYRCRRWGPHTASLSPVCSSNSSQNAEELSGSLQIVLVTGHDQLCAHAGTKSGGQALLGGLDCTVHRNFFGAQICSFVTKLKAPACMKDFSAELEDFRAVFIRLAFAADHHIRCMLSHPMRIHATSENTCSVRPPVEAQLLLTCMQMQRYMKSNVCTNSM